MLQESSAFGRAFLTVTLGLWAISIFAACSRPEAVTPETEPVENEVLATLGDLSITMEEVRDLAGEDLDQLELKYERDRHELIEETLQKMIRDRLLEDEAERQGQTVLEILRAEEAKVVVTDQDVAEWYQENRAQTRGRSLEELAPQIEELLVKERRTATTDALVERLWREREVAYHLEPLRVELSTEGSPALGPANAPITLVEFSDFECPFCARFYPSIEQLRENYGDRLRIVYRQFPIPSIHPHAMDAARASLCAHEQDRFWEMHDLLFEEQDRLEVDDLKEKARLLGLDRMAFDDCLDSGRYGDQIQRDLRDGRSAGVTGTPALFVNGILVPGGAVPYETIAAAIDQELQRIDSPPGS